MTDVIPVIRGLICGLSVHSKGILSRVGLTQSGDTLKGPESFSKRGTLQLALKTE